MQKLAVEGTVRWRCAVLVVLKNWMLKLRGLFESLVIQDLHSAGSSEVDMLSKHTSPSCLARGDYFFRLTTGYRGPLHENKNSSGKSKHHVLTYIRASSH